MSERVSVGSEERKEGGEREGGMEGEKPQHWLQGTSEPTRDAAASRPVSVHSTAPVSKETSRVYYSRTSRPPAQQESSRVSLSGVVASLNGASAVVSPRPCS